jgi:RNA-directed DNA polymerase
MRAAPGASRQSRSGHRFSMLYVLTGVPGFSLAGYFGLSQSNELPSLDSWIRRRLRCVAWIQWKTRGQRHRELRRLNVPERSASAAVLSPKGPWRLSFSEALHRGFTKARFRRLGLRPMEKLVDA